MEVGWSYRAKSFGSLPVSYAAEVWSYYMSAMALAPPQRESAIETSGKIVGVDARDRLVSTEDCPSDGWPAPRGDRRSFHRRRSGQSTGSLARHRAIGAIFGRSRRRNADAPHEGLPSEAADAGYDWDDDSHCDRMSHTPSHRYITASSGRCRWLEPPAARPGAAHSKRSDRSSTRDDDLMARRRTSRSLMPANELDGKFTVTDGDLSASQIKMKLMKARPRDRSASPYIGRTNEIPEVSDRFITRSMKRRCFSGGVPTTRRD